MIKVKFRDGTTELRFETSPCRHGEEYAEFFASGLPTWGTATSSYAAVHNLARCARGTNVSLWRLSPSEPGKPITGQWEVAYVETVDEQIVRIEGERDAALTSAKLIGALFDRAIYGDRTITDERVLDVLFKANPRPKLNGLVVKTWSPHDGDSYKVRQLHILDMIRRGVLVESKGLVYEARKETP